MGKNRNKIERKGSALLVVLLIVMAATILSLGFLSRSDAELSCGENMILRTQMDYLAESGLEHAGGLILDGQEVGSGWTGQLVPGSDDYYSVVVSARYPLFDPCEPNLPYSHEITCTGYREKNGERAGESVLNAELHIDPSTGTVFRSIERHRSNL